MNLIFQSYEIFDLFFEFFGKSHRSCLFVKLILTFLLHFSHFSSPSQLLKARFCMVSSGFVTFKPGRYFWPSYAMARLKQGTLLYNQILTCFSPLFQSKRTFLLKVSFKILVPSRHWSGMSQETRLQNGEKTSRDWSSSVAIWSSRCQSSQSIIGDQNCYTTVKFSLPISRFFEQSLDN